MAAIVSRVPLLLLVVTFLADFQEISAYYNGSDGNTPYKYIYPPVNISIDQESCSPDPALNRTCPLYIALIMSFGGSYTSSGVIPAMEVALDQINSDPNMLPGYTLHYTLKDSQCNRTRALDVLHTELIQPPTKIAVVGSGCSLATEPTAEVSHYYNLTQLSCKSSSPELKNRTRFPRLFQLSIDDGRLIEGFFTVIKHYNWRRVLIIVQDEKIFTMPMFQLQRSLEASDVNVTKKRFLTEIGFTSNPLRGTDSRIFILSMYEDYAREILCMAHNISRQIRYPRNLFLVNSWYSDNWWEGSEKDQGYLLRKYNCTAADRKSTLPFTLTTIADNLAVRPNASDDNGYTGNQFKSDYDEKYNASKEYLNTMDLSFRHLCFDGIWMLARALNKTIADLKSDSNLQERLRAFRYGGTITGDFGLQHFKYDNNVVLENIFTHLSETNFNGIVGNISFHNNGTRRLDTLKLQQYRFGVDGTLRIISVATIHQNMLKFELGNDTLWKDGVPYDGVPMESIVSLHVSLTVIFSVLATCGIVFALVCITLNTHFRDKKLIRLTSPKLNNLIGVGAVILYFNMYTFIIPTKNQTFTTVLCNLNPWLTAIGYSLCYGTILAKMCRVYYIFNNPSLKKKVVKDWILALFVLLLLIIDIFILLMYTIIEGARGKLHSDKSPHQENSKEIKGVREEIFLNFIYVCISVERSITLAILYGYKALLQIIALVLALSIRKVSIKGLNDAVYIITAIYVSSIVTVVIIISTYTLVGLIHVYALVFCLCLFIGTTMILILVFIPPLIGIHRDPDGTTVFKNTSDNDIIKFHTKSRGSISGESDTTTSLRKRIKFLENKLQECKCKPQGGDGQIVAGVTDPTASDSM